ncbi:stromal membrane-associated protein [Ophiocordyceps camponoti-floridani]|uniref:Stromal membrane-associated protein n=1 Tax=Ophiocordyceps camponoti-floridani TaxID=2030778 RepID=A0A8H4QE20_9HYPO|nr:stromal membrane-associated protein [Ophiocordyceps camponoti-floridani]
MSRHVRNPDAERAAQNQATIKSLLKLEANKVCADCKRNKHPRWASWNLGIFICIRCSGIHRGMGTHISRVKSVDLDSWTDEQLQSILNWGNARANKYWESKLNPGHCPSEAKMENFIRTKYELKRWVMDGPIPDPSTLKVDGDDDVPLSLVKEKQAIERKTSLRRTSVEQSQPPQGDLIGSDDTPPPSTGPRTGNVRSPVSRAAPKAEPAATKTTAATASTRDSLLGLDFLGGGAGGPPRPSSTPSTGGLSRPDLKQSILSLYASTAKPQAQQPQQPPMQHPGVGPLSPGMGGKAQAASGLGDAMGGLSISTDPFASLGSASSTSKATPQPWSGNAFGGLSGGGFFDTKPAQAPAAALQQPKSASSMFGGSDFGSGSFTSPPLTATTTTTTTTTTAPKPAASAMDDLFDLTSPAPQPTTTTMSTPSTSVFNLSAGGSQHKPTSPAPATATSALGGSGISAANPWGGNEWITPDAPATMNSAVSAAATTSRSPELVKSPTGWGGGVSNGFSAPPPKVTADEEFGGWTSSAGPTTGGSGSAAPKTGGGGFGGGGDDDLFSNVWQ